MTFSNSSKHEITDSDVIRKKLLFIDVTFAKRPFLSAMIDDERHKRRMEIYAYQFMKYCSPFRIADAELLIIELHELHTSSSRQ